VSARRSSAATAPLVSVLTPTYNNAAHLEECIESVLAQTYEHWTYVIVDDASTDRTLEIALSFAAKDERIRVEAHPKRLGVPGNWNRAMRTISDESAYCKVLHGDDRLYPQCLEMMVELAAREPSVGVVGAYRIDGLRVNLDGLAPNETVVPGPEISRRTLLGELYVFGSPTSLLLRSDLVRGRDPFYPEGTLHADTEVCFELLRDIDFGFVHQVLTFTRRHSEAVTSYALRVGTYKPETIELIRRYGPVFLSRPDYERALAVAVAEYALFLAHRAASLRDPEFRAYHRDVIRKLRGALDARPVLRGALRQLAKKTALRS
jgi:glycosyltransferase involved in cell wall biosynthesis